MSENVNNLADSLEIKHGEGFLKEPIGNIDQHDFFLLAYFMALGRHERPRDFVNNLNVVRHELNQSFSVAIITALARAQMAHLATEDTFYDMARDKAVEIYKDPNNSELSKGEVEGLALIGTMEDIGKGVMTEDYRGYSCTEWLIVDEVLNDESLEMDMRPEAREIITKYMKSYQDYCDGIEDYWKPSKKRG